MKTLLLLALLGSALGHGDLGDDGNMASRNSLDLPTEGFLLGQNGGNAAEMNTTAAAVEHPVVRSKRPSVMIEVPVAVVEKSETSRVEKHNPKRSLAHQLSQSPTAVLEVPVGIAQENADPMSLFADSELLEKTKPKTHAKKQRAKKTKSTLEEQYEAKRAKLKEQVLPVPVPLPRKATGFRPILFFFICGTLMGLTFSFILISSYGIGFCYCFGGDSRRKNVEGITTFKKEVTEEAQCSREKEFAVAREWLRKNANTFMTESEIMAAKGKGEDYKHTYETLGQVAERTGAMPPPLPPLDESELAGEFTTDGEDVYSAPLVSSN